MANYKMNFATKTLTISREFSNKAIACPNSKEYQIMEQCRSLCPDLKIAYFTRRSSSSKPYGGMTYTKMENYIKLYENADELLERFSVVKEVAKIQKSKFGFVYNWFITQFPNYDEMPEIRNGKLYAPVVGVPEVEERNTLIAA